WRSRALYRYQRHQRHEQKMSPRALARRVALDGCERARNDPERRAIPVSAVRCVRYLRRDAHKLAAQLFAAGHGALLSRSRHGRPYGDPLRSADARFINRLLIREYRLLNP